MKATLTTTYKRAARKSRDQLILDNVDYVARILSTMTFAVSTDDARENLQSAGTLGLVEAANSFEPDKGVPFRTYAYSRIRGAIVDELRKQAPVSQMVLQQIGLLKRAYESLEPPATPEILASRSGLTVKQVASCLEAMRFIKPDDWNDLSDIVHGSWRNSVASPDYEAETEELQQLIADSIESLPERERLVLTLYYTEELTLGEIGRVLELSESRISRILATAKFRLQEIIRCKTG